MEKISIPEYKQKTKQKIDREILDYYDSRKGEGGENEDREIIKEKNFTKENIIDLGKAFDGPYMRAFTDALADGKNMEEANQLAQEACIKHDEKDEHYNPKSNKNGAVYGNVLAYTSHSGTIYELIDDEDGNFRFVFPDHTTLFIELEDSAEKATNYNDNPKIKKEIENGEYKKVTY
jgi:hypothetical protein